MTNADTRLTDIEVQVNRGYGITVKALTDAAVRWMEDDLDWEPDSTDQPWWMAECDTSVGVVVALDAQGHGLRVQVVDESGD